MVEPNENFYKNFFLDKIFSFDEQEEKSNPNENCENKAINENNHKEIYYIFPNNNVSSKK